MNSPKRQSRLAGATALMIAQGLVLVLGWVSHILIGRVLGEASYGVFGVVLSIQTIFGLFLTLGVPVAVSRFVAQSSTGGRNILLRGIKLQLIVAMLVSGAMVAGSFLMARLLRDTSLVPYIWFAALVVFTQALYPLFAQFLSGKHYFNRQALLTAIYAIIKLVGALSLLFVFQIYGAFAGFAIGGIVAAAVGWWWTRTTGGKDKPAPKTTAYISFAGTFVLILVGLQILISLDLFMVKALLKDDVQTGYYNAAVTLSRIPYMLLNAIGFVLLPSVSALTRPGADHDRAARFIRDAVRYLIMLIVPSVSLAAATSRPLVQLFYSSRYEAAAASLSILMIGLGSLAFFLLLANIISGAGRPRVALVTTIVLLLISGGLGYMLIPRFGLIGAAWQTTFSGIAGLTLLAGYTWRTFKIPVPLVSTMNVIIATVIAILPTYFWHATPLTLIPQYVMVGVIYIGGLILLGEISADDRRLIANSHSLLKWVEPKNNK